MKNIDLMYLYPERYCDHQLVQVSNSVYNILKQKESTSKLVYQSISTDYDLLNQIVKTDLIEMILLKFEELTLKQQNRIYEKYFLGMSTSEIARLEDCSECAIRRSINRGINQLRSKVRGKL